MSHHPDPFGLVGRTLGAKYIVDDVVAETEFSVVYRATHRIWKRSVAIKTFKAPMLAESAREALIEGFVREGMLLMDLSERCAAICQARDVGSAITSAGDWVPYMVLEWLEGESLEARLARERASGARPRTVRQAIGLVEPIAHALTLAHERRVVHLDVKPGNIFLMADASNDEPRCKLLDFGVAQVVDTAAGLGAMVDAAPKSFTPAYGAPEQFDKLAGPTGPWTDVFALALVFVELVSGREALKGESVTELRASAESVAVRPTPRSLGVIVPSEVERVLARALAVNPGARYPNVGDFWFALTHAASARPAGAGERRSTAGADGASSPRSHYLRRGTPMLGRA
jgi:serine/threonine protein kinase